ncbi:hypothetical protein MCC93_18600 [Morococcus cerebrosus]|uniref:Uncharacterized protein n=1 Tax=Morococcus cerebrosus TaxID=1056807 RepID=A0A0C1ED77_9NEIS|nr:hypothetical protein MCC93_18600 [Morococcus cerebrosus]
MHPKAAQGGCAPLKSTPDTSIHSFSTGYYQNTKGRLKTIFRRPFFIY